MAATQIGVFDDELKETGYKFGYCRSCNHRDCEEVRRFRKTACGLCHKNWKPTDWTYKTDEYGDVHRECLEATIWMSWERKTAIVWNEGYDAETKLGEGLTEKEEAELNAMVV